MKANTKGLDEAIKKTRRQLMISGSYQYDEDEVSIEIGGRIYEASFTRSAIIKVDRDYASDEDGNRGIEAYFVADESLDNVYVNNIPLDNFNQPTQIKFLSAIGRWTAENEFEIERGEE